MEKLNIHFKKKDFGTVAMIAVSSFIYSIGMNVFVNSGNLFPGGYSGISRIISLLSSEYLPFTISFSIIYFSLNILTTLFVWKDIGHKFIIYSVLWYSFTSLFTTVLPYFTITEDSLLIAVFGGLINGLAIGIALKNNASSGGSDFIAIDLSIKLNRPTWNYIFAANACVLCFAGLKYGWNQALYSIIFQYVSKEVVNTLHKRYKTSCIQCVTDHPDKVTSVIFHTCRHGVTRVSCEGEFTHSQHSLLIININTYQLKEVVDAIQKEDPKAFLSISSVERVVGNYYQKPLE